MKRIWTRTYGPLSADPFSEVPWEDVFLRYHVRRKRVQDGVTLVSRAHLEHEIDCHRKANDVEGTAKREALLLRLRTEFVVIDPVPTPLRKGQRVDEYVEVYTHAMWITRREAERMLDAYIRAVGGFKNLSYQWRPPPMPPMSLPVVAC